MFKIERNKLLKKICITVIIILSAFFIYNTVQAVTDTQNQTNSNENQTENNGAEETKLTSAELEQRRLELQEEMRKSGLELENIQIELTEALEKINDLDKQIYEYEQNVEKINKNLETIEEEIKNIQEELQKQQKEYTKIKKVFEERIVYLYETNETRYLDVLLNSKSIVEFISNYYMIGEMAEYDANLIEKLEHDKEEIQEIEKTLRETQEKLEEKRLEKQKLAITLENSKVVKNSYINSLTEKEKETQEKLEKYQEELDLIELEMLVASMENNTSNYVGGIFLWPAPGYYTITSPFGMRLHPILKVYRGHTGMDIGAPMGSYVLAANSGVVTKATYSMSYGNCVMINHGNGISTLYAHGSEILTEVGKEVKRGDVIMKVGSTGWSTGPHLHFEIIINGIKIDPYPYVTRTTKNNTEQNQNNTTTENRAGQNTEENE